VEPILSDQFAILNANAITESTVIPDCNILVSSGKIVRISQSPLPAGVKQVDAAGGYASPGFIDLHVHGFGGYDATEGDVNSILGMSKALVKHGTTSFLPTLVSTPIERIRTFLDSVAKCMPSNAGANILGAHLEGPFLNPLSRGVHREEYLMKPSTGALKEMIGGNERVVRIVTLAPELDGGLELCREIVRLGFVASIGHTNATCAEANRGIEAGITHSTHTFNAMPRIAGREPGAAGAVLASDKVRAEIIADGLHLTPEISRLAVRSKQPHGLILVTDAVMATGTNITEFNLAGVRAFARDGGSFTQEGNLCGSTLTLERAVKNLKAWNNLSLPNAIRPATLNPAEQLGIDSKTGSLKEGKDADIVILDKELRVTSTYVKGVQMYSQSAR
jgi:N-acetylglucosamine-6-phosphate deacetylase